MTTPPTTPAASEGPYSIRWRTATDTTCSIVDHENNVVVIPFRSMNAAHMLSSLDDQTAELVLDCLAHAHSSALASREVRELVKAARGFLNRVSSASGNAVFSHEAREIVMNSVDEIGDALAPFAKETK